MLVLVIGASASGKSEFAESLAMNMGSEKLYIATMQPFDDECVNRIKKHQLMRRNKGFSTKEVYKDFEKISFESRMDVVLIECMSNLVANEIYSDNASEKDCFSSILEGIKMVNKNSKNTIIVSNEIFSDGDNYSQETLEYMDFLGKINIAIAKKADVVIEIVSGLPIYHKGRI